MSMTTADTKLIAQGFKEGRAYDAFEREGWLAAVISVARVLAENSNTFDARRFMLASGVQEPAAKAVSELWDIKRPGVGGRSHPAV
jgi:hypothetical protein